MKKLSIAIGCITAIVLMSSCTNDTIEETKNTINKNMPETLSAEAIDSVGVTDSIGVTDSNLQDIGDTDKDRVKN